MSIIRYATTRSKFTLSFLICCLLALLIPTSSNAGWKLTFQDEFATESLDLKKWKPSDLWGNQTLSGNNEQQCYVPTAFEQFDGVLSIVAARGHTAASKCKAAKNDLQYTSGMITTAGCNKWETGGACASLRSFSQAFGYFEIRMKIPKGQGLWPAFWLMPIDGSASPEIDVVEILGHKPTEAYHTYHFIDQLGRGSKTGHLHASPDFSADFHTFGVDWQPDKLIWYVDGKETYRFSGSNIASKPVYLLINLAVGGYWPGQPDQTTPFPARMQVDYIRVYKRVEDGRPDDMPPRGP